MVAKMQIETRYYLLLLSFALVLTGCGRAASPPSVAAPTAPASTSSPPIPFNGAIVPGSYLIPSSEWSVADFTVTFPEGWTVQYGHVYAKHQDEDDEFTFYAVVVDEIYTDSCEGDGVPNEMGPEVDDLVAALREQPGLAASAPVETTLGGYPATRIDLQVEPGLDLEACRLAAFDVLALQVWYSAPADKYFVLGPDSPASVYILEVNGERQVFLTQHRLVTSAEDLAELQAVLDSIHIEA